MLRNALETVWERLEKTAQKGFRNTLRNGLGEAETVGRGSNGLGEARQRWETVWKSLEGLAQGLASRPEGLAPGPEV